MTKAERLKQAKREFRIQRTMVTAKVSRSEAEVIVSQLYKNSRANAERMLWHKNELLSRCKDTGQIGD